MIRCWANAEAFTSNGLASVHMQALVSLSLRASAEGQGSVDAPFWTTTGTYSKKRKPGFSKRRFFNQASKCYCPGKVTEITLPPTTKKQLDQK